MSLVREVLQDVPVMKIEGSRGRPVYSLGDINIGQIRNTFTKLNEYWYFGERAKPYLTFFFQSIRDLSQYWNENEEVKISYTEPCSGCSKCYEKFHQIVSPTPVPSPNSSSSNYRWWHSLLPRKVEPKIKTKYELEIERMKNVVNDNCENVHEETLNCKNILIQNNLENDRIDLISHDKSLGMSDFINEGIQFTKDHNFVQNHPDSSFLQRFTGKEFNIEMKEFENYVQDDQIRKEDMVKIPETIENVNSELPVEQNQGELVIENENEVEISQYRKPKGPIGELDNENPVLEEPAAETEDVKESNSKENDDVDDDSKRWLSIDNENYEVQSKLNVQILPRRLQIYLPTRKEA